MPLMPLSSVSPHWPVRVGNCASHGQFVQMHKCTDREKPMEITLIWILSILIGVHISPYHLSEAAEFTGPTLTVLCSLLVLTSPQDTLIFPSVCHWLCKARPAGKAGRLGSCEGGLHGEEGRTRKACHWLHTEDICFVPFLIISAWQGPLLPPLTAAAEAQRPCTKKCPQHFASSPIPAWEHLQRWSASFPIDVLFCSETTALDIRWSYSTGLFFGTTVREDLHGISWLS